MFSLSQIAGTGRRQRGRGLPRLDRQGRPFALRGTARPNTAVKRALFSVLAATADAAVIALAALVSGLFYQQTADAWDTERSGLLVSMLFLGINAFRHDYEMLRYLSLKGHLERSVTAWLAAFGVALMLAFMTKTTAVFSRGAVGIFFVVGFAAVMLVRQVLVRHIRVRAEAGQIVSRRVILVGAEHEILAFIARYRPSQYGMQVVGAPVLRDRPESLGDDLALAVATARMLRPDEVFLLVPWNDRELIDQCVDMFRRLPAAIHLGPARFLDRFHDMRIDRAGPISSVHLVRSPLSPVEVAAKRAIDIVAASSILLVFSPLLALVALAIKLDSRGPVFFLQRRYGFNQEPFRIFKFRSMSTLEDGATLRQVTDGDTRVTRVGRLLRRTSIDELPQLINVLKGDMSLVGPRPHALAHDQLFERTIALYARRHNVRPGITGWAQVRGWRGETDTPEKIQGRVEHDLHYIDNWSLWFDIMILLRTVLSRETFRNAK